MARTNATAEVSLWHFLIGSFLLAALGLGLGLGLTRGTGDGAPHLAVIAPTPTPTPSPTPTVTTQPTPTAVPTPTATLMPRPTATPSPTLRAKVVADVAIKPVPVGDGVHIFYTFGGMITGPGTPGRLDFPLVIEREAIVLGAGAEQPGEATLAKISDPGLKEVGAKWESNLIQDPLWPKHVMRVELEKLEGLYKYRVRCLFSSNGGTTWSDLTDREFLLYPN